MKYQMKITTNDSDNMQSRIIIEVNGHEIDILADNDGAAIEIRKSDKEVAACSVEWGA